MASEKQRKQDNCVLAVSHEQCKTLSIEKVGTLAQLLPKASMYSSNRTTSRHAIKNLAFRVSTCLPLRRWICQLVLWGISMWIFEHKLFWLKSKFCPLYHQSGTARKSITLTAMWTNATDIHLWESNSGNALRIYEQYVNHFSPQLYQSARLPLHVIRTI